LSADIPDITEEIAQKFLALLMATQMLSPETEPTPLESSVGEFLLGSVRN
jgi:hypothetical protein